MMKLFTLLFSIVALERFCGAQVLRQAGQIGAITDYALSLTENKPAESSLEDYLGQTLRKVNIKSDPLPSDYQGYIEPLWTCGSDRVNSVNRKVIFVHVFKTAGSTFRSFFDLYGTVCHKGTTVVIECNGVASSSMIDSSTPWASAGGKKCVNKQTRNRATADMVAQETEMTGKFLQENTDIVIGHLPMGVHAHWPAVDEAASTVIDAQYLTFFREPVAKYVSGRLFSTARYSNEVNTFDNAVNEIKERVTQARAKNEYYNAYRYYLLTPEQKEASSTGSIAEEIPFIKQNLVETVALVGIVERMGESLALMQSVLDVDTELTSEFQSLNPLRPAANATQGEEKPVMIANKSALSTGDIVKALKEDTEFFPKMLEYLKYEFDLYDYALRLHKKQVEQMHEQHGKRYYFA